MKDNCNKGLLIPWLLRTLNEQHYEGLQWSNKQKKIFYIVWTHKAAEHWSTDVLEPFKAWAKHKGKLAGKNEKQLKATFRCALNSKKDELREVYRNRCRRYWQFVDSDCKEGKSVCKKRRRLNSKLMTSSPVSTKLDSVANESTIPDSTTEDCFEQSGAKDSKKKRRRLNYEQADGMTASALHDNDNGSFFTNDLPTSLNSEEKYNLYSSMPPASRLTPPADSSSENYYSASECNPALHHYSTDVWQPNCWPITPTFQDFSDLNQFNNDFDQTVKSPSQEFRSNRADFTEKDQSVPIINRDNQMLLRNGQFNQESEISFENQHYEQMTLEDEYFFASNIFCHTADCENLLQELKSIPTSPETGTYSYCS